MCSEPQKIRPNFVFIIIDCWRYDYFTPEVTPNIWNLAKRGVSFQNYYVNGYDTSSSMPAIFSSQYPYFEGGDYLINPTGFRRFRKNPTGEDIKKLPSDLLIFPELLKNSGYKSIAITQNPKTSIHEGYGSKHWTYIAKVAWQNNGPLSKVTSEAIRQIRVMPSDKPFFLFLHYMDAHVPYNASNLSDIEKELLQKYSQTRRTAKYVPNPDDLEFRTKLLPMAKQKYLEGCQFVDAQIGHLLKQSALADSIIIITADHGEMFNEIGEIIHPGFLPDEVVHVPLIIYTPHIKPRLDKRFFESVDLMPTILAMASIKAPSDLKGQDLFSSRYAAKLPIISSSYRETAYISKNGINRVPLTDKPQTEEGYRAELKSLGYLD